MKIFSSSPYAIFNSKDWNKIPRTNNKFSNAPIKIKKIYFSTFKNLKPNKTAQDNNHQSKQMKLALT